MASGKGTSSVRKANNNAVATNGTKPPENPPAQINQIN